MLGFLCLLVLSFLLSPKAIDINQSTAIQSASSQTIKSTTTATTAPNNLKNKHNLLNDHHNENLHKQDDNEDNDVEIEILAPTYTDPAYIPIDQSSSSSHRDYQHHHHHHHHHHDDDQHQKIMNGIHQIKEQHEQHEQQQHEYKYKTFFDIKLNNNIKIIYIII